MKGYCNKTCGRCGKKSRKSKSKRPSKSSKPSRKPSRNPDRASSNRCEPVTAVVPVLLPLFTLVKLHKQDFHRKSSLKFTSHHRHGLPQVQLAPKLNGAPSLDCGPQQALRSSRHLFNYLSPTVRMTYCTYSCRLYNVVCQSH